MPESHKWNPALKQVTKLWKEISRYQQGGATNPTIEAAQKKLGRYGFRAGARELESTMDWLEEVTGYQFRYDSRTGEGI